MVYNSLDEIVVNNSRLSPDAKGDRLHTSVYTFPNYLVVQTESHSPKIVA